MICHIENCLNNFEFAIIHCCDFEERHRIYKLIGEHNSEWKYKSMLLPHLDSTTSLYKCIYCKKISPEKFVKTSRWDYDNTGPGETSYNCPHCEETYNRDDMDSERVWFKAKNVIIVYKTWKGKKYYHKLAPSISAINGSISDLV